MMNLKIRAAGQADIGILVMMNRQLIDDEGSRNPMGVDELAERMWGWLEGDWQVLMVEKDNVVVGYMLYREQADDYFRDRREVYIRQYFIRQEARGQGIGRTAFEMIVGDWLPRGAALTLEVLAGNVAGLAFWERVGFAAYSIAMRRESTTS